VSICVAARNTCSMGARQGALSDPRACMFEHVAPHVALSDPRACMFEHVAPHISLSDPRACMLEHVAPHVALSDPRACMFELVRTLFEHPPSNVALTDRAACMLATAPLASLSADHEHPMLSLQGAPGAVAVLDNARLRLR
jgi:hypothetical protein